MTALQYLDKLIQDQTSFEPKVKLSELLLLQIMLEKEAGIKNN